MDLYYGNVRSDKRMGREVRMDAEIMLLYSSRYAPR
jgi:hypothetical protein